MPKKTDLDKLLEEYEEFLVNDEQGATVEAISTGSPSLDFCLGTGGIPRGRITEVYGPYSSGKTTLSLSIAANAIKSGLNTLYVDVEHTLDYNYARAIIGDFDATKLKIIQPQYAEQVFRIIRVAINSGLFGLIILDSVGALVSESEKNADEGKSLVGKIPALLTVFCKQSIHALKSNNVALLVVNQVRDKIGGYVGGYTTPGGNAIKHFTSIQIALSKAEALKVDDKQVGAYTAFSTKKNKLAPPFKSETFPIIFGTGIDYYRNLIEFATTIGVVSQAGAFYKLGELTLGRGMKNTKEYLLENPKVVELISNSITELYLQGDKNGRDSSSGSGDSGDLQGTVEPVGEVEEDS